MMSTTYFVVIHHTHLGLACNVYIGTPLTTHDFVYVKGTDFSIVKIVTFSEEIAWHSEHGQYWVLLIATKNSKFWSKWVVTLP